MRFAEHMLLESTCHTLRGYQRIHPDGARCALGLVEEPGGAAAERLYPWIDVVERRLPCECDDGKTRRVSGLIAHLFNRHVRGRDWKATPAGGRTESAEPSGKQPWTLDRLAEWIDSVDPAAKKARPAEEIMAAIRARCEAAREAKKIPRAEACGGQAGREKVETGAETEKEASAVRG
jgi:hypothetical protein